MLSDSAAVGVRSWIRQNHSSSSEECPSHAAMFKSLYGSKSMASLSAPPMDDEPGPGSYEFMPGFGVQFESQKWTGPAQSFKGRQSSKVLISKHHLADLRSRDTPGAGTYQPQIAFSSKGIGRFAQAKRTDNLKYNSPGPIYDQALPASAKIPVSFTKSDRFSKEIPLNTVVGPGEYESGTQFDGSYMGKSFGMSWPKSSNGDSSPGPYVYNAEFGTEAHSHAFARSLRPAGPRKLGPGPGTYDPMVNSESHRLAKPVCSFGSKPSKPKPRLDFKTLARHTHTTWGLN